MVPAACDVRFYAHKAEFRRTDHEISVTMEIAVAPDDDVEIRRITLHNQSERPRRLALTSYGEVVMAAPLADQRHPAFNKLFIESEYLPELGALLYRRRPRAESEAPVFLAHLALGADDKQALADAHMTARTTPGSTHESDRARSWVGAMTLLTPRRRCCLAQTKRLAAERHSGSHARSDHVSAA